MKRYIGVLLALVRHFVTDEVIDAIKRAAMEALANEQWDKGERTQFVIDSVRDVVAATDTPIDDFLVEIAARLYLQKYANQD